MATKKPAPAAAAKKPGTAVAVKKASSGAVVDIKAQMAAQLAALNERTAAPGGNKIQLKNKQFVLPDGSKHDELPCVIVDFVSMNTFYEGSFDPKNIQSPVCFAIGTIPTQMAPPDHVPVKQSDTCAACPMNQYESAATGKGKACKNMRRLAVLPPGTDSVDDALLIIDVAPTGLKSFDGYVRSVASKFQLMPVGVVTTISFDQSVDYSSLRFGNPEPNECMAEHWNRIAEAKELLEEEPDTSGYTAPAKPGARKPMANKAAARR